MKLDLSKVVDSMTLESCIPTDSVKSGDDHSNLVHNKHVLIQIKPIRHTWLVKIMKFWVDNIRIKRGQCEVWITICIGIIVIIIHITKMSKTKQKQANKQTNKQKKKILT